MSIPSFQAQLFGAGLPAQGTSVHVELRSRELVVQPESGPFEEVDYRLLRAGAGGWDGRNMLLEWDGERGLRSLSVHRAEALAVLRQSAPPELRARLGAVPRRSRAPQRLFAVVLVALVASVVIALVTLAAGTGRLVDAAVRRVPVAWETQLGAATIAPYALSGKLVESGPAFEAVESIGARLLQHTSSPYTFRWYLVRDKTVNAMAAPGGSIVVFTGLLAEADTAEEVAGVLAHEMQHVILQHSLRGILQSLGLRALVSLVFGSSDAGALIGGAAEKLGGLRFSRQQESDADQAAVELLAKAGIGAEGMATFFEKLASAGGEPPAFLSTHPASRERAERIRALAREHSPAQPLTLDWARVRAAIAPPDSTKE